MQHCLAHGRHYIIDSLESNCTEANSTRPLINQFPNTTSYPTTNIATSMLAMLNDSSGTTTMQSSRSDSKSHTLGIWLIAKEAFLIMSPFYFLYSVDPVHNDTTLGNYPYHIPSELHWILQMALVRGQDTLYSEDVCEITNEVSQH